MYMHICLCMEMCVHSVCTWGWHWCLLWPVFPLRQGLLLKSEFTNSASSSWLACPGDPISASWVQQGLQEANIPAWLLCGFRDPNSGHLVELHQLNHVIIWWAFYWAFWFGGGHASLDTPFPARRWHWVNALGCCLCLVFDIEHFPTPLR